MGIRGKRRIAWMGFVALSWGQAGTWLQPAIAAETTSQVAPATLAVRDIRLDSNGTLAGGLTNANGRPSPGVEVQLWQRGANVARVLTDDRGAFHFAAVRPGTYQILAPQAGASCRAWQAEVAPPIAKDSILLVQGDTVRGQGAPCMPGVGSGLYGGSLMNTLSSPWVFAGAVGTAVAVPIALDNGDGS